MTNWVTRNKKSIIRSAFLIPIFSVAAISISHVVSWYDLANPIGWAIYLSIAVEVAAMSAIAATSAKVKGFSVWFVFIIVTLIQFIGNIFFSFSEIDSNSKLFKDWVDLTAPVFEAMGSDVTNTISQKRWLALLEGGLLPLISLTCLHFFIKYGEIDDVQGQQTEELITNDQVEQNEIEESTEPPLEPVMETPTEEKIEPSVGGVSIPPTVRRSPAQMSSKLKKIIRK
jgi:hypothetical protein